MKERIKCLYWLAFNFPKRLMIVPREVVKAGHRFNPPGWKINIIGVYFPIFDLGQEVYVSLEKGNLSDLVHFGTRWG